MPGNLKASSMDANDLTTEQATRIREALVPALGYLGRLCRRMEQTGFVLGDRLYSPTTRANDVLWHLCAELHYLSCCGGVGAIEKTAS
ncbi:MAG TPA: hypothetical protein VHV55_28000 [Pirellulales bacterium]|jgi:hypothetical protein|nr:hypothetical protein [Pirellulales bacterium]